MNKPRTIAAFFDWKKIGRNNIWVIAMLLIALVFAVIIIITLLMTIINQAFGYVFIQDTKPLAEIAPHIESLDQISKSEKIALLTTHLSSGLIRRLNSELILNDRSHADLDQIISERVINPVIIKSYTLWESIFQHDIIEQEYSRQSEHTTKIFRAWLRPELLSTPQSPKPEFAGVRTAILGSLWMMVISLVFSFPIGVATAIYLEEYAKDTVLTRLVRLNIYNLAGIPSIIYGILGLALFVRLLEPLTSGRIFGMTLDGAANGRTIISAGATLGLLILPIIIINAQEAIRGTPQSIRDSSFGLGATKWQTIWSHVLPYALERIITGAILAVSRAIGETAPLVVVGAATFITVDPKGIFSKFTVLPIQIYQWSVRPQDEFRHLAAGAIIVLLALLLSMNAIAIIVRNHYSKKKRLLA